ncbi:hypothetical protein QAD02_009536 [Eretmocerus hayati]|uniref:Uncharacterized protein n=1 Tax=Eretmocerus hayati TaxID=131215 RepID=A0ACC2NAB2_9HYME|nr:hypothetical protein QAD02_009536 [Eretmocerus hayati]
MFSQSSDLRKHMYFHEGQMTALCEICGRLFRDISSLNRHLKSHSPHKSFNCNLCDKRFKYASGAAKHMKAHARKKSSSNQRNEATLGNTNELPDLGGALVEQILCSYTELDGGCREINDPGYQQTDPVINYDWNHQQIQMLDGDQHLLETCAPGENHRLSNPEGEYCTISSQ